MNQREKFELWLTKKTKQIIPPFPLYLAWSAWQAAQAAKDAELQELRANLAKCRKFMEVAISPNCVDNYFYLYLEAKEACGCSDVRSSGD